MKITLPRILGVTAALLAAGFVFGALTAVAAAYLAFNIVEKSGVGPFSDGLIVAGVNGALLGSVLLPVAWWGLLRRVPPGLAFVSVMVGTMAGGIIGWVFTFPIDSVSAAIGGAVLGFSLAALGLRLRFSAPEPAADAPIAHPAGA
jgi:hypothetical protein